MSDVITQRGEPTWTAQQALKQLNFIRSNFNSTDDCINGLFADLKNKLEKEVVCEKSKKMKQSEISSYFKKV